MSAKFRSTIALALAFSEAILAVNSAQAQYAQASSLAGQLRTEYRQAKIVSDSNGYRVTEPGTMLVIQKEGITGAPLGNSSVDPVIYAIQKDTDLHHPASGANTWKFEIGHKVYLSKLDVDADHGNVFVAIVERDSSSSIKASYYKSLVVFEFPNGYLAAADARQVEDVISQVLMIDGGNKDAQPAISGGQDSPASLTNDDIVRLVQAKLPDKVVMAKIKSSTCSFDTGPDALIRLKQAGVSDSLLQAIVDAPSQPNPPGPDPTPGSGAPQPGPDAGPACNNYDACIKLAQTLFSSSQWARSLARFQEASQLDASRGDAWAGIGYAYVQMGQYDDAFAMLDKALLLGYSLSASVCHAKAFCGDIGTFQLSTKEVSFVNKKGEKEFSAAPSEVTSEGAVVFNNGQAYYLQLRFAGKNYRFFYLPVVTRCNMGFICPEPGLTQQKMFGDYIHERLVRIAAGDFGSPPNKP